MNCPSPMYIPVWVMSFDDDPKNSRSPGCRSFLSTLVTPLHAACKSASRGMLIPRARTSICVNPEQSYPKLDLPPHKYGKPRKRLASSIDSGIDRGIGTATTSPVWIQPL